VRGRIGGVGPGFRLDDDLQGFETIVAPADLLSALWLQLADALETRRDYKQCAECGKWFSVLSQGGKPREYCSEACRIRAYRKRKKGGAK
jgi:hypothetical protein